MLFAVVFFTLVTLGKQKKCENVTRENCMKRWYIYCLWN